MANQDQSYLEFGPLRYTGGWGFTTGPGVEPASCVVTFSQSALESLSSPIHDLVFRQGDSEIFRAKDSHLVRARMGSSEVGLRKCTILDRRWRWQYAHIDGSYNVKQDDGPFPTYLREKTPQELAALLFEAMGEANYLVTDLPDDVRPPADWQGSRADSELLKLCSSLGCYPALDYATDTARIFRIGSEGVTLPPSMLVTSSTTSNAKPLPKTLRVVGGPAIYQSRLALEAVGLDTDGSVKPLFDLSYMLALKETVPDFYTSSPDTLIANIADTETYQRGGKTLKTRDLATATCFKMYRVAGQSHARYRWDRISDWVGNFWLGYRWTPPSLEETEYKPESLDAILPLRDTKITRFANSSGKMVEHPATVHGRWTKTDEDLVLDLEPAEDGTQWPHGFTIQAASGIVVFSRQVFLEHEESIGRFGMGVISPADLEIDTSYTVNRDGVFVRYETFEENADENSFGSFRLSVPALSNKVSTVEGDELDNREEIEADAQKYLQHLLQEFEPRHSQEKVYSRIWPFSIDGTTRQITWSGGGGQASTTRVSLNSENNTHIPRYEQRRDRKLAEAAAVEVERLIRIHGTLSEWRNRGGGFGGG